MLRHALNACSSRNHMLHACMLCFSLPIPVLVAGSPINSVVEAVADGGEVTTNGAVRGVNAIGGNAGNA